jgi:hypothetical protein
MNKYLPDNHDMARDSILRDEGKFVKPTNFQTIEKVFFQPIPHLVFSGNLIRHQFLTIRTRPISYNQVDILAIPLPIHYAIHPPIQIRSTSNSFSEEQSPLALPSIANASLPGKFNRCFGWEGSSIEPNLQTAIVYTYAYNRPRLDRSGYTCNHPGEYSHPIQVQPIGSGKFSHPVYGRRTGRCVAMGVRAHCTFLQSGG